MQNLVSKINKKNENTSDRPVVKSELWLGTELLKQAGFSDTLENHFKLVDRLGHDMICLPVCENIAVKPNLGYRYFQCDEIKRARRMGTEFVAAVVDGPFQELVNQLGLMEVLTGLVRNRQEILCIFEKEHKKILDLINRCLDQGAHTVVIADDLAADRALLIRPADVEMLCGPFYEQAVSMIHGAGAWAFYHCCGKITQLVPQIKTWQFDGLAAVQHRANDLVALHEMLGQDFVIMAGIDAELLDSDSPQSSVLNEFQRIVKTLVLKEALVLSTGCGLYSGDFLERMENIYSIADRCMGA